MTTSIQGNHKKLKTKIYSHVIHDGRSNKIQNVSQTPQRVLFVSRWNRHVYGLAFIVGSMHRWLIFPVVNENSLEKNWMNLNRFSKFSEEKKSPRKVEQNCNATINLSCILRRSFCVVLSVDKSKYLIDLLSHCGGPFSWTLVSTEGHVANAHQKTETVYFCSFVRK